MPDKPTTRSTSSIVSISRATSDLLAIVRGTHAIHMRTRIACPGFAVAARPGRDGGRTRSGRGRSRSGTVYRAGRAVRVRVRACTQQTRCACVCCARDSICYSIKN
jgi:hypothetical protein